MMDLWRIRDSDIRAMNDRATVFIGACGYETRSTALVAHLAPKITHRHALAFTEWPTALARKANEEVFKSNGFVLHPCSGSDTSCVRNALRAALRQAFDTQGALVVDVSSMTRAWHGVIVRELSTLDSERPLHTFLAYVPALFQRPPRHNPPNEVVAPVDGFAALTPPDLPVVAVIGLGYEHERALGLQQLLDPQLTILMLPCSRGPDLYYPSVVQSNRDILRRVSPDWVFKYPLDQPTVTFQLLSSIIGGLRQSYRVVLTSLGPKLFGLHCFLVAARDPSVSVWRVSAGIHGEPRDAKPAMARTIITEVVWNPSKEDSQLRVRDENLQCV
jgi:hypothetical protein